jgi:hypothetical protein
MTLVGIDLRHLFTYGCHWFDAALRTRALLEQLLWLIAAGQEKISRSSKITNQMPVRQAFSNLLQIHLPSTKDADAAAIVPPLIASHAVYPTRCMSHFGSAPAQC